MTGTEARTDSQNAPLKILAIHRYYWPDTPPYASMLRSIVRRWVEDGHDVDVLSSQPSYKATLENKHQLRREHVDGAAIHRMDLPPEAGRPVRRIMNALKLGAAILFRAVVCKRYDVIMVSTSPPVLAGWFTALAARLTGARFIYHCMDVHPEIGRISGEFGNSQVFQVLLRLDSWACRQADPVVVLSSDMARSLEGREGGAGLRTSIINNFSLPSLGQSEPTFPFSWPQERFVLLFAGNIGRFQGLETLIQAMGNLKEKDDVCLVVMGEGTAKNSLKNMADSLEAKVYFVGHHPVETAKQAMQRASVGFVSLVPGLYKYAYPSKTMTYLEQGCPVLVAVEPHSQLARDITDNVVGLAVPGGDPVLLKEAIVHLAEQPDGVEAMRQRAMDLARQRYSEDTILEAWSMLLSTKDGKPVCR